MIPVNTTDTDIYTQDRIRIQESQSTRPVIEQVIDPNKIFSTNPDFVLDEFDVTQTTHDIFIQLSSENQWESATEWKGEIRKRFDELSVKDALGEITTEELKEFNLLLHKRRMLHHPRSSKEIEMDIKNSRALRKVMEGLSEYVRIV